MSLNYKRAAHSVYCCRYHIIMPTKYRRAIFKPGTFSFFCGIVKIICKRYPQIQVEKVSHDKDHVYMLVSIAPSMSVGDAVRLIKCNTSRVMLQRMAFLRRMYADNGIWSDGYFASTTGIDIRVIRNYVKRQGEQAGDAKLRLSA